MRCKSIDITWLVMLFLVVNILFSASLFAQPVDENRVKAAYLVNFIKHIKWPDEKNKTRFIIAIYKDRPLYRFLVGALSGKQIRQKAIVVILAKQMSALKKADLVYIPQNARDDVHTIANLTRGNATLIVSHNSLNKHDIMINLLHNPKSSVITFEVNKSNIIYEQLALSPELLLLGGSELDIAKLYRETELAMQKTRHQSAQLKKQLNKQQQQLIESKQQLEILKTNLQNLNQELHKKEIKTKQQQLELNKLKAEVADKQKVLNEKSKSLARVTKYYEDIAKNLAQKQKQLSAKEVEIQQILQRVEKNKQVLLKQTQRLAEHRDQLEKQQQELLSTKKTISNQQNYIVITTVLIVLAIFIVLLIIILLLKNKKVTKKLKDTLDHLEGTQAQLVQAEKMASLGTLVAGVAHEINTPLSIAITANSLVLDDTQEVERCIAQQRLSKARMAKHINKTLQSLDMGEKALERVKILLTNFKQVAADQVVDEKRQINLSRYIDEVISTLSVEMKKHNVSYQFTGETELILTTYPGALAQVLTNLVTNSIKHGFDDNGMGTIMISLQNEEHWAKITYQDNGAGMSAEVLKKIFEPFFTTKRGKGSTGLGMNIVYNIINQKLNGTINVKSEQGVGSTFTIALPKKI